jgi:hypothetical protein
MAKQIFLLQSHVIFDGVDPVKDRKFLEVKAAEIGPFEEQWVNGDCAARGFASLDALFKRLMAGDEA